MAFFLARLRLAPPLGLRLRPRLKKLSGHFHRPLTVTRFLEPQVPSKLVLAFIKCIRAYYVVGDASNTNSNDGCYGEAILSPLSVGPQCAVSMLYIS
mmetsp:Transcript_22463/g.54007  ORF Transcript_22463/g.54007 Transcript_22463/m.54007 type:complete len:97 (+) Transcript_22463:20-310(+)